MQKKHSSLMVLLLGTLLMSSSALADISQPKSDSRKLHKTSEAEKGYQSSDIQKGWAFGEDANIPATEEVVVAIPKGKRDVISILEESLAVQKEQLKEQRKIRAILEEQFDPKPHMIRKEDGTQCVANSSADCFEFPLIAEAKRVPVMANYLKNPHDMQAVAEWKKWFSTYLNHTFDIGRATEYDTAANGSNTFKTDYISDGYDSAGGHFSVEKGKHNSRLLNAFGTRGLSLKILLGKTKDLDLFAMDQIAMFIKAHPSLPVELVFFDRNSAEIYSGGARSLGFVGAALSQRNVTKRISVNGADFPETLQATPAFEARYANGKDTQEQIIKSGKIGSSGLASAIVEWMIFKKIIDPAQLNAARVWRDSEGYGAKFIKETYGESLRGGSIK